MKNTLNFLENVSRAVESQIGSGQITPKRRELVKIVESLQLETDGREVQM